MTEQTTMRAVIEKAKAQQPLTEFESLLLRAAMALQWLADRGVSEEIAA